MMALELTILTSRSSRSLLARRRVERSLLASLDGARRGSLHSKDRLLPSRSGRPLVSCSQRMQSIGARSSAATLIEEEKYGAFSTLDEDADGYYIVQWTSTPYTLQEDMELKEYTPAIRIKAGELVCDAVYYNKVAGARGWYTPTRRARMPRRWCVSRRWRPT